MAVNFFGVINLATAVLPHMRSRKAGCIAFTNSVWSHAATPANAPYGVSKHAVHGICSAAV
jgi:NAD(P)-dependent dehydrogenase (short-subunit alcohol dehydrogenase family)